jgi:hypothetical protein
MGGGDKHVIEIWVVYVGLSGRSLFNYSLKVGKEANRWIGIDELTEDIKELDSVTVIREHKPK